MESPSVGTSVSKLAGCEFARTPIKCKPIANWPWCLLLNWPDRNLDLSTLSYFRAVESLGFYESNDFSLSRTIITNVNSQLIARNLYSCKIAESTSRRFQNLFNFTNRCTINRTSYVILLRFHVLWNLKF